MNCAYHLCNNDPEPDSATCAECKKVILEYTKYVEQREKSKELISMLGIAVNDYTVHVNALYDLFMDEEKMRVLNSKLKNKVFW